MILELLNKLGKAIVFEFPYPHLIIEDFFPPEVYSEIECLFCSDNLWLDRRPVGPNKLLLTSVLGSSEKIDTRLAQTTSPKGQEALLFFTYKEVWETVMKVFGLLPDKERRFAWRGERTNRSRSQRNSDFFYDVQVGINTPAAASPSRVRGIHVDQPQKLFNALIYFRSTLDDCPGGDLGLYRFRNKPQLYYVNALDLDCELVKVVPYRKNTLVLMKNSEHSLHGVLERSNCPHERRYINVNLTGSIDFVDIKQYQASKLRHQYLYSRFVLGR